MDFAALARLSVGQLALLIGLFLPGFVSIKIDRLIHPGDDAKAPELVIDAFGYSVINAAFLSVPIFVLFSQLSAILIPTLQSWLLGLLIYLAGPALWPIAFRLLQRLGAQRGWLMGGHRFAWDDFFTRREPAWVIVHLPDGSLIGGYFGEKSYATLAPQSGHLYLEQLWRVSDHGEFLDQIPSSKGALFRPSDYHWIELIEDEQKEW